MNGKLMTKTALAIAVAPLMAWGNATMPEGHPVEETPTHYVGPKDPAVLRHLEEFREWKIGLFMHFGLFSTAGLEPSWPLCDSVARKLRQPLDWTGGNADEFKRQYYSLIRSFNPVRFQPKEWAKFAKNNGFKYLVFTTKHHDGFCLWDTKTTDFKVTSKECPFSSDPRADIVRHVFDAFRAEGLGISCYLSKPDFNHPDYWDNRGIGVKTKIYPTYDTRKDPARWDRFCAFAQAQALELVRDYGKIDVLWLDSVSDIHPLELAEKARKIQPDLIIANRYDRHVCEDFLTPEGTVPRRPLTVPWESCITMYDTNDGGWGYYFDENYMSPRAIIHLLIDVVSKGGNLALNVGPTPAGTLPTAAMKRLESLGAWLKANGAAIYATHIVSPYRTKDWAYTAGKDGATYALRLWKEGEKPSRTLTVDCGNSARVAKVTHVASGREIAFRQDGEVNLVLTVPDDVRLDDFADAFRLDLRQ